MRYLSLFSFFFFSPLLPLLVPVLVPCLCHSPGCPTQRKGNLAAPPERAREKRRAARFPLDPTSPLYAILPSAVEGLELVRLDGSYAHTMIQLSAAVSFPSFPFSPLLSSHGGPPIFLRRQSGRPPFLATYRQ